MDISPPVQTVSKLLNAFILSGIPIAVSSDHTHSRLLAAAKEQLLILNNNQFFKQQPHSTFESRGNQVGIAISSLRSPLQSMVVLILSPQY